MFVAMSGRRALLPCQDMRRTHRLPPIMLSKVPGGSGWRQMWIYHLYEALLDSQDALLAHWVGRPQVRPRAPANATTSEA